MFPRSIGYLENFFFDIWYVTSPSGTLPSLLKLWLCGQNGLNLDVTEFALTYKLKHTKSPFLKAPDITKWTISKFAPNRALGTKMAPPRVRQEQSKFLAVFFEEKSRY